MSDENVLYRMRDQSGALLYVGITLSVEGRLRAHRGDKPWWPDIASIQLEHFASREDLEAAEIAAIRNEAPMHNLLRYKTDRLGAVVPAKPLVERPVSTARAVRLTPAVWDAFGVVSKGWPAGGGRPRPRQLSWFTRWYVGDVNVPELDRPTTKALQRLRVRGKLRTAAEERPRSYPLSRVDPAAWSAYCSAAIEAGCVPAVALGEIVHWYLRLPDAELPPRPED